MYVLIVVFSYGVSHTQKMSRASRSCHGFVYSHGIEAGAGGTRSAVNGVDEGPGSRSRSRVTIAGDDSGSEREEGGKILVS